MAYFVTNAITIGTFFYYLFGIENLRIDLSKCIIQNNFLGECQGRLSCLSLASLDYQERIKSTKPQTQVYKSTHRTTELNYTSN